MQPKFDYINALTAYEQARHTEGDRIVKVIGNPNDIAYEWLILHNGQVESYSNKGYGLIGTALRDGLIALYGEPEFHPQKGELNAQVS